MYEVDPLIFDSFSDLRLLGDLLSQTEKRVGRGSSIVRCRVGRSSWLAKLLRTTMSLLLLHQLQLEPFPEADCRGSFTAQIIKDGDNFAKARTREAWCNFSTAPWV